MLLKFGVPPKLVSLLKALHSNVKVKFEVGGVCKSLDSIIGVKQGDLLGPELFTFFQAAVMITWRKAHSYPLCMFNVKADFVLSGRRIAERADGQLAVYDSLYADDAGLLFPSRKVLEEQAPAVVAHFARWGMGVHVGHISPDGKVAESKTEVLFCPAPASSYSDPTTFGNADLPNVELGGGTSFPVVPEFKYLGSYMAKDCSDTRDVDSRIEAAGKAFGALSECVFRSLKVNFAAKRRAYEALVLSVLLYGCECWSLTEVHLNRLRAFHHRCVRTICRVTLWHTWKRRITMTSLLNRAGLWTIDMYVSQRQLRWLGHVCRMDFDRLPRKMLSCWVDASRPRGAPQSVTYARGVYKAMGKFNIDRKIVDWPRIAQDRFLWASVLAHGSFI